MPQIAIAKQFASHVANDVELFVANPADARGADLQPKNDWHPLRRCSIEVHSPGSHRRRRDDLHVVFRNPDQVSEEESKFDPFLLLYRLLVSLIDEERFLFLKNFTVTREGFEPTNQGLVDRDLGRSATATT